MKIATVLVNYNGYQDTVDCVKSLLNSKIQTDIFVVDNASKNDEAEKLERDFSTVTIIKSDKNLGFSGANNLAIQRAIEADYDYVMLLNNDTEIASDMVELLLSEASENCVVVPSMYYFSEREKLWYAGGKISKFKGGARHFYRTKKSLKNHYVSFATGCCMLIHSSVFQLVGLLDERYFMYCEDVDFCIRLARAGIKIRYIPQAKLWHKVGRASGGDKSKFNIYYGTRNRLYLIQTFRKEYYFTAYPFTMLTRYVKIFLAKLKRNGKDSAYGKAIKDYKNGVIGMVDLSDV